MVQALWEMLMDPKHNFFIRKMEYRRRQIYFEVFSRVDKYKLTMERVIKTKDIIIIEIISEL